MPHIHEKYDFVVAVYIVYENTVLLVNHPRYNMWAPIGGHIELGEDPEEALFREIKEEVGIEAQILSSKPNINSAGTKPLLAPNYLDVHEANSPHKHISLTYFAKTRSNKSELSAEHLNMKWFSTQELTEEKYNLSPAVIFYAHEALRTADKNL